MPYITLVWEMQYAAQEKVSNAFINGRMLCAVSSKTGKKTMSVKWTDRSPFNARKTSKTPKFAYLLMWSAMLTPHSLSCQLRNRLYSIAILCLSPSPWEGVFWDWMSIGGVEVWCEQQRPLCQFGWVVRGLLSGWGHSWPDAQFPCQCT